MRPLACILAVAVRAISLAQSAPAHHPPRIRMVNPGHAQRGTDEEGTRVLVATRPQGAQAPDSASPGAVPAGTPAAAARQDFLLQEAAKALASGNRKGQDPSLTQMVLTPEIDPKTGLPKEAVQAFEALAHNETLVDRDAMGPIGPGRRERLAEIAGISPEEAKRLWPFQDPKPFQMKDLTAARKALSDPAIGLSQEDVLKRLQPGQNADREEMIRNAVLTDAEASFAVYAGLGLPFPVRVGKVDAAGITEQGLVLFSPELMRADILRDDWTDLRVTYRWMLNEREVYRDSVRVEPFQVIPRPSGPVTHLLVTCDKDVMLYALRGVPTPHSVQEARDQIVRDVVPVNSWLRCPTKLYGIRWGVLPTVDELVKNPGTRKKLGEVLLETGMVRPKVDPDQQGEVATEFRQMADYAKSLQLPSAPAAPRR